METNAEQRMLNKLQHFVQTDLDVMERRALARLIAPGVEEALFADSEVQGFGGGFWMRDGLAIGLANLMAQEVPDESGI
jgi:hypothetical protein